MSVIAWVRRRRLTPREQFSIEFHLAMPSWSGSIWDRVLSTILVIAVLGIIGTLGYAIATPKVGKKFTEFYILGLEGKAENYPKELVVGGRSKSDSGYSEPGAQRCELPGRNEDKWDKKQGNRSGDAKAQ